MKFVNIVFVLTLFLINCNTKRNASEYNAPDLFADTSTFLKVYEDAFHNITLNGRSITVADLDQRFKFLKANDGIVFYSCAGAVETPPGNSEVIELIKKYKLSIKIFSDSSFKRSLY